MERVGYVTNYIHGLAISTSERDDMKEILKEASMVYMKVTSITVLSTMGESNGIVHGPVVGFSEKELEEMSLDQYMIAAVQERSNDTILMNGVTEETLKVNEFLQRSYKLAAGLQALGCGTERIVGFMSENRAEFPIVILGTLLTGATVTPYNPENSVYEFRPVFNITKPTVIFCSATTMSTVEQVVPASTKVIIFDTDNSLNIAPHLLKFSDLVQSTEGLNAVKNEPDKTAVILYSSGTTALPKAAMLTHKNLTFQMKLQKEEQITEVSGSMTLFNTVMYHISGLIKLLTTVIRDEIGILIPTTLDQELFLSMVQKYKLKTCIALPAFVTFLLKDPAVDEYDLSSLEFLTLGGDSIKPEIEYALKKKLNLRYLKSIYGMTETTLYSTITNAENRKLGTCGSPIPGTQMKIVDTNTGKILGKNETGEIQIKGPHVMKGYFNNKKATAENIQNGWLRTGDIAYYDDDGDFFIVGRAKELIKCGGSQVSPAELESLFLTHPSVADVAVIGIPDERMIELPRAFVVKKSGIEVTADEIIRYFNGLVQTSFKKLEGVEFVSEIPRNPTGKILRRKLKERWDDRREKQFSTCRKN